MGTHITIQKCPYFSEFPSGVSLPPPLSSKQTISLYVYNYKCLSITNSSTLWLYPGTPVAGYQTIPKALSNTRYLIVVSGAVGTPKNGGHLLKLMWMPQTMEKACFDQSTRALHIHPIETQLRTGNGAKEIRLERFEWKNGCDQRSFIFDIQSKF